MCGEAGGSRSLTRPRKGPSPRVRGSPPRDHELTRSHGSIPACAGKPWRSCDRGSRCRVHPRVCGEARHARRRCSFLHGPSPRVRGSRVETSRVASPRAGPAAACAGNGADRDDSKDVNRQVHPRRVRGQLPLQAPVRTSGSIPACAGKPPAHARSDQHDEVHPRVCGEAAAAQDAADQIEGPSPRVRGSLSRGWSMALPSRSIPACAGKPVRPGVQLPGAEVHPRVCGEAQGRMAGSVPVQGPSPRVRGSPGDGLRAVVLDGSIPACAGKPAQPAQSKSYERVHPRVCGEAILVIRHRYGMPGPSPRVRGSQGHRHAQGQRGGSIPACAGKPRIVHQPGTKHWVHPRVCGEAGAFRPHQSGVKGPSPRVRGSRLPLQ